ncbi:hypothetical protein Lal_00000781 [Lupinus albus]|nr:hypothetical protein Lal_00000781 [Lupinus albus]
MVFGMVTCTLTHTMSPLISRPPINVLPRPISHVTHCTLLPSIPLQTTSIRCSFNSTQAHKRIAFNNVLTFQVSAFVGNGSGGRGDSGSSNSGGVVTVAATPMELMGEEESGPSCHDKVKTKRSQRKDKDKTKLAQQTTRYLALLEQYPVLVKALTSAILTLIGDLICQVL